jgi:hypothetical protein
MESNYSDLDGSVELYDAVLADSPVMRNYYDADNFYPANGLLGRIGKGTILDKKERARRRALREKRKGMRAEGKLAVAQSSKIAAQGLGKESQADIELAKSLNAKSGGGKTKTGMSTTTKVLIGVGVLAVLVGGYFAYKKFSKGK